MYENDIANQRAAQSVTEKPSPSFTDQVMERLKSIMSTTSDANEDLGMVIDRTFGSATMPGEPTRGETGPQSVPCRAEIIFEMLDAVQSRVSRLAVQARGLNSRI